MTAAALDRRPPPDPRLLQRCLLLAVLLHVWLVLIFGNATGVAEPGQGVWGSLTVKLLGRSGGDAGAPPADAAQRQPRQTTPPAAPGAAELGRPNPREVAAEAARSDEVSPAAPSTATLELPEGFRPIERQDLSPPPRSALPQMPPPELPTTAVGRLESRPDDLARPLAPAASLRAPSRPAELPAQPADLPAPVHRLDNATASPSTTATLPRPTELRPLPTPAAAVAAADELPPPVSRLEAPTAPSVATPLPRPAELRTVPSRIAAPDAQATTLPAPVQRLEAVDTGAAAVTPLTRPSELRPPSSSGATAPTALPSRQDLPTAVQRLESAEAGSGVTPLEPLPGARASLPAPGAAMLGELAGSLPGQVAAPAGPARGDPNASPVAAPRASLGTPDAGSRLGPDLPSPPSAAASAPRAPLNLSLPRGDIAARRGPGLVDLLPQPPERKSKLEQSIEDAANKDCRKAYAGAGLLAVVPLAVDAARGKGCKW